MTVNRNWDFGISLTFISIYVVANTYTCLGVGNITVVACSKPEQEALLKFKHNVSQDDNHMLSSWVGDDCCMWERVRCDGKTGYIEGLHLTGFTTEISFDFLKDLEHLKFLDLSGNTFQGSRIPEFIGSLKQLSYLNLSDSAFSGNIPHHIGNLTNLKVLDLSSNNIYYPYLMVDDMAWLSGLSSLEYLDLSDMDLSGAKNRDMVLHIIPSLVTVSLSRCRLTNADLIPLLNSSTTLSNIKHLDLGYNSFYGQVPHIFQNMTSLQFLDLSSFNLSLAWNSVNFLTTIPSLLELRLSSCSLQEMHLSPTYFNSSKVSNIRRLYLFRNLFQGKFPSVITNMTSLQVLDLSYNSFDSTVPVMPNLLDLDLSGNAFKHIDQVGIWRQCQLRELRVSDNVFPMELMDSTLNISGCSKYALKWLYLDQSVTGTIPESLGRMDSLIGLDLSGKIQGRIFGRIDSLISQSKLTGAIPKSLGSLKLLKELDLSDNSLTGSIPTFTGKLTKVDLSNNQLNGSIPESLGRLRSLEVLDLSVNQLQGLIPTFLGKLTRLDLSYNNLGGSIPESVGRLVSLQAFSASANLLTGSIPVSIGQLTELNTFDVSYNSFEGIVSEAHFAKLSWLNNLDLGSNSMLKINISHEWMPPFQLIDLDLSFCKIENGFPRWLRNQRKLESLVLSNATMSGPLPTWLGKLPFILYLDLSYNKLSGPLFPFNENRYSSLFLQNNFFSEVIPRSLCTCTALTVLELSKNGFIGTIPDCLGNLRRLFAIKLSSNGLSGVIPSSLGNISPLNVLSLNENNFIGELPLELGNLEILQILDLGDNGFSGNIPKWVGEKLTSLVVLRLHKNNFTGGIPQSLCQMSKLQILDVAHNNLLGSIPHCVGELERMADSSASTDLLGYWDKSLTQVIKGLTLEYTKTLKFLINMDLSSNKLAGEIPMEITTLCALLSLNLSNNLLSGDIPKNVGNMKALNSLDLSINRLTGTIPPSLATLNFLSHLNLSYNNLSRQIPTGNQLQTLIDPSIYVGNKDLCGAPLPKNCPNPPTSPPKTNYKTGERSKKAWLFSLNIMSGFATGFWGVIGVLVWKKQWRQNLFMFAESISDKIYVAVMVRVARMRRE